MTSPYREPAEKEPAPPRPPTPEEEMRLILLDEDCRRARRPGFVLVATVFPVGLVEVVTPFVRRWLYKRKLRAAGVATR